MFAKDLSNKIFSPPRHQGTKFNYNKHLFFVSWCLCGYSFRFIRFGYFIILLAIIVLSANLKVAEALRRPDLSGLTREERQSIEVACILAKGRGPAEYNACLHQQLQQLKAGLRRPDLSGLTRQERQSIEAACLLAKGRGPAKYNICLHQQLEKLGAPIKEMPVEKAAPKRIITSPSKPPKPISPSYIRRVQNLLSKLGYDAGPIDGIIGKQTKQAINEFQRDFGLPITGRVDNNLMSQLKIAYQLKQAPKTTKPPKQISKSSPRTYHKIPRPVKVLPAIPLKS